MLNCIVGCAGDTAKTEHLKRLEGAKERLHLFKADLMEEGSFDSAIAGCEGVFHAASPVNFNVTDPQVSLILSFILDFTIFFYFLLNKPLFRNFQNGIPIYR